jgi:hypothetical protein
MATADNDHIKFLGVQHPEQMAQFLRGIEGQPPGNVTTIVATGQWYVPMRHPGMPAPYDLRGWHASPAPATSAASSPR